MAQEKTVLTRPSDREQVFTRTFDAPRELVFKVWTSPEHIVRWWSPNGFTTTSHGMDVRPGGVCKLTMHGPDGTDYKNRIYTEVVAPEKLVYHHAGEEGDEQVHIEMTVTFEAVEGGTKVTLRQLYGTAEEERERVVTRYGADKGGVQTIERLGEYLAGLGEAAA